MSYEEASRRENALFEELRQAINQRSRFDATASVYSDHRDGYDAAVDRLLGAVQAYEAAAADLVKARAVQRP